jgi:hypothetical protein
MNKSYVVALGMVAAILVRGQNAPTEFRGTVEYFEASPSSLSTESIFRYNGDGTYDVLFGWSQLEGVRTYAHPQLSVGPYTYRLLDATHGLVTRSLQDWTIEYTSPGVGSFSDLRADRRRSTFITLRTRGEMVNSSLRGYIAPGKTSIAGFVITRGGYVLIRAVGPGLKTFGVVDALPDPGLTLYRSDGRNVDSVGSWRTGRTPAYALTGVMEFLGAFPLSFDSDDAVLFASLEPGVYSVVTRSISGTQQGEVLTEVYAMP